MQAISVGQTALNRFCHETLGAEKLYVCEKTSQLRSRERQRATLHADVPGESLIQTDIMTEAVPERIPTELGHGLVGEANLERIWSRRSRQNRHRVGRERAGSRRLSSVCSLAFFRRKMYADSSSIDLPCFFSFHIIVK